METKIGIGPQNNNELIVAPATNNERVLLTIAGNLLNEADKERGIDDSMLLDAVEKLIKLSELPQTRLS